MSKANTGLFREYFGFSLGQLEQSGHARKVASDLAWGEGPAYLRREELWVFSDIPNNRMLKLDSSLNLGIFRQPSNFSNGNYVTDDGRLLTCEHGTRRLVCTTINGTYEVLCDVYDGGKLNSPNDVVQAKNGDIWFTDPTYGICSDLEGFKAPSEQQHNRVYKLSKKSGLLEAQIDELVMPNGLCFSPDETLLYVADSGAEQGPEIPFDQDGARDIFVYQTTSDGNVYEGRLFATVGKGVPDGMRCDDDGFLWVATGQGLECYSPEGDLQGLLVTEEIASNLCFGGENRSQLMITLESSAWLVETGG